MGVILARRAYLALGLELPLGPLEEVPPSLTTAHARRDRPGWFFGLSCSSVFQEPTMFPPQKQPAHPWKTHPVLIRCSTKNRRIQPM